MPRGENMFRIIGLVLTTILILHARPLNAKSMVEAKSSDVKVYAKPEKNAQVIKELQKGDVLESEDRKGMYWKVKLDDGSPGFVSVMQVKRKSVESDDKLASELRKAVQEQANSSDSSIRTRSAVMGVRGLDESKDIDFIGNVKPNLRSVYNMENMAVEKKELEKLEEQVFAEIENKIKN